MSRIGSLLRPQSFSAISKATSTTTTTSTSDYRDTLLPRTQYSNQHIRHVQAIKTHARRQHSARDALEDRFVALLLQAGSCQSERSRHRSWSSQAVNASLASPVNVQRRFITTHTRRSAAAAVAKIEHNEHDDSGAPRLLEETRQWNPGGGDGKGSPEVGALRPQKDSKSNIKRRATQGRYSSLWSALSLRKHERSLPPDDGDTIHAATDDPFQQTVSEQPSDTIAVREDVADVALIPRKEYRALVDIYGMEEEHEVQDDHVEQPHHFRLAPRLVLSAEEEDKNLREVEYVSTAQHARILDQLTGLLKRKPGKVSQQHLWNVFSKLPHPQVRYLRDVFIDRLFLHLAWVEYRSFQGAKESVFELLRQCNNEHIPVEKHQWTIAITLAGRWVRNIQTDQVKEAIETWMRMEECGVEADPVVFNVLYDIAAKAGRFALADTIFNEMKSRDMPLNRYFRCSKIHLAGMRKDGDAVRAAFNDFVTAGEIVDTQVMNLVIRSLIRSDEGEAAEHVFENMKSLHAQKFPARQARAWQERRLNAKQLNREAAAARKKQTEHESSFFGSRYSTKEQMEELQRLTPIHPDAATYRTLIGYHALVSGNVGRIQELIREMKDQGQSVHGSIYTKIFFGFFRHGGLSFSAWTPELLEGFWKDFTTAILNRHVVEATDSDAGFDSEDLTLSEPTLSPQRLDHEISVMSEDDRPVFFSLAVAKNIILAFCKCCGNVRMVSVVAEIRSIWKTMSAEEDNHLSTFERKQLHVHPRRHPKY